MRNAQQYKRLEFIGRPCRVADAGHRGYIGLEGVILDETKNTLVISTGSGEKRVPKPGNTFRITFNGKDVLIDGRTIAYRPEDRIKKIKVK